MRDEEDVENDVQAPKPGGPTNYRVQFPSARPVPPRKLLKIQLDARIGGQKCETLSHLE